MVFRFVTYSTACTRFRMKSSDFNRQRPVAPDQLIARDTGRVASCSARRETITHKTRLTIEVALLV